MVSATSPRHYLEHARDYLGLALDLVSLTADDERWSRTEPHGAARRRTEAIMDQAMSVGDTPEADRLRVVADDMLTSLHARTPELIAATSRAGWFRARTHLTAGLGLLRYHRQSAKHIDQTTRVSRLLGVRDALMAQNLLAIRDIENGRGATFAVAQNRHLQRNPSRMSSGGMELEWFSAGAIVAALAGERYTFVTGSLARSAAIGLGEPEPDTYEASLQRRFTEWGLAAAAEVRPARVRTDMTPEQGYLPLDQDTPAGADAVLHVGTRSRG